MTQPPGDQGYFTPPPAQRPYGAPPGGYPPLNAPWAPGPAAPAGPPLASPGRRLLARLVDGVIVAVVGLPLTGPLLARYVSHLVDEIDAATTAARAGRTASPEIYDATTLRLLVGIGAISLVVSGLYEVPQLARWGRTLGKRACRLQVVRRDAGPAAGLGWGPAGTRWLVSGAAPAVPWVGGLFGLIDALWLLWDRPWRQCLHDKAAATIVVRTA